MNFFAKILSIFRKDKAFISKDYWESRYKSGGNSGAGSYGEIAIFKATVVNRIVENYNISSVLDFGCGDGNQLSLANYKTYIGLDVSHESIKICKERFKEDTTKTFFIYDDKINIKKDIITSDLTLSMEVIFHLTEDEIYKQYLNDLFSYTKKYVCIYSTNFEKADYRDMQNNLVPHVRHREFSKDVSNMFPDFRLVENVPTPLLGREQSQFFLYEKEM